MPVILNEFKDLNRETNRQLEYIKEELGRHYKLLDSAIKNYPDTDISVLEKIIIDKNRLIRNLEVRVEKLEIIIAEKTSGYNSRFYTFYCNIKYILDLDILSDD